MSIDLPQFERSSLSHHGPISTVKDGGRWSVFVPTMDAFTMFYQGMGPCLIRVHDSFTKVPNGVLLIEHTVDGGRTWTYHNCEKLDRGIRSGATDFGPCVFKAFLASETPACGLRIRCQDTVEMEPIKVSFSFAGVAMHVIRRLSEFTIHELPTIEDLV